MPVITLNCLKRNLLDNVNRYFPKSGNIHPWRNRHKNYHWLQRFVILTWPDNNYGYTSEDHVIEILSVTWRIFRTLFFTWLYTAHLIQHTQLIEVICGWVTYQLRGVPKELHQICPQFSFWNLDSFHTLKLLWQCIKHTVSRSWIVTNAESLVWSNLL